MPEELKLKYISRLSDDIKYKIAEDTGIGYDDRRQVFNKQPELFVKCLIQNMSREDRSRAVLDLLLDMEAAERTEQIIVQNSKIIRWTAVMAVTAIVSALIALYAALAKGS